VVATKRLNKGNEGKGSPSKGEKDISPDSPSKIRLAKRSVAWGTALCLLRVKSASGSHQRRKSKVEQQRLPRWPGFGGTPQKVGYIIDGKEILR